MFQCSSGLKVIPFFFFVLFGQHVVILVFHPKPSLEVSCCLMGAAPQNIKCVNDDRSPNMVHIFVKNKIVVSSGYAEKDVKDVLCSAFLQFT